mmetsp:Transcript_43695/g.81493  ORF Transcript_43695/g.81493 Transcript_43695/m.81493 type:complete len:216 (-) Transcript_43695:340-987(-)
MMRSPGKTAFSANAEPRHCRFQASTAPPGRTPSTFSTWSSAECDTLSPSSAPSALRRVKLKIPFPPTTPTPARPLTVKGEGISMVGVSDCIKDSGWRCGVSWPKDSAIEIGAAGERGIGEEGSGKAGTSGKGPASFSTRGCGVKGAVALLTSGSSAVVLAQESGDVVEKSLPLRYVLPTAVNPAANSWTICFKRAFSSSRSWVLFWRQAISSKCC